MTRARGACGAQRAGCALTDSVQSRYARAHARPMQPCLPSCNRWDDFNHLVGDELSVSISRDIEHANGAKVRQWRVQNLVFCGECGEVVQVRTCASGVASIGSFGAMPRKTRFGNDADHRDWGPRPYVGDSYLVRTTMRCAIARVSVRRTPSTALRPQATWLSTWARSRCRQPPRIQARAPAPCP